MGTGKFYLRPSADISVGHTLHPADSTAGYLLINEETADNGSTYICLNHSGKSSSASSQFMLTGNVPTGDITITGIKLKHVSMCSTTNLSTRNVECSIDASGVVVTTSTSVSTTYTLYEHDITDASFIDVFNSDNFPSVTLTINTVGATSTSKSASIDTTQVYLEISYDDGLSDNIGVHTKVNGAWVAATKAYRKLNGVWTEITADECKQILSSSLCRKE